jgi:hypothetical protein
MQMSAALTRILVTAVAIMALVLSIAVPSLAVELHVNRFTGAMRIENPSDQPSENVDGYSVSTDPDDLPLENVIVPANWNSLTDQLEPGWEEVVPAGQQQTQITELNLTGSKLFAPGAVASLGNAYDVSVFDESLLNFEYKLEGQSTTVGGGVFFEGGIHLRVNKSSGVVEIVNGESVAIDFDSYVIQSPDNLLEPIAIISLQDQMISGWEEVNLTSSAITELNLTSSSVLGPGQSFNLGALYTGGLNGLESLTFEFRETAVRILAGVVEYVTGKPGDFNNDDVVDAADYTTWRDNLGATDETGINGNGDGANGVDAADYDLWKTNFGVPGSGAVAVSGAVPEPTSALLLFGGLLAIGFDRRGMKRM